MTKAAESKSRQQGQRNRRDFAAGATDGTQSDFEVVLHSLMEAHRIRRDADGFITPYRKTFVNLVGLLLHELPTQPVLQIFETIGYQAGQSAARLVATPSQDMDLATAFRRCLDYSDATGFTEFELLELEIDADRRSFSARVALRASVESEAYTALPHAPKLRVCAMQSGYLSGMASELLGRRVTFTERCCRGEGEARCELHGTLASQPVSVAQDAGSIRGEPGHTAKLMPLVGKTSAMQTLRSRIAVVANTRAPVLIQGETGTGKELIARSLHMMSSRDRQPLVTMNCGALQETLVEAELFGVEKGAYTGATRSRPGRFQQAHGGTLFLDEIGLLSLPVQGKLLRVLEDGCFDVVGGRTVQVDVRLIAASNVDLAEAVRRGGFREDLYFRLCTIVLWAPPLRERQADILPLANHFLADAVQRHGKSLKGFTPDAIVYLENLPYPGNVRELRQIVEAAAIFAPADSEITAELLQTGGHQPDQRINPASGQELPIEALASSALAAGTSLPELEKALIEEALQKTDGNLAGAARLLGISRRQIEYRVKGS